MTLEEMCIRDSIQMEGDILFAQQDYAGALAAYEKVNTSNIASPATFFSAAKTKDCLLYTSRCV